MKAPPAVPVALAFGAGILASAGAAIPHVFVLLLPLLMAPFQPLHRPRITLALVVAVAGGLMAGRASERAQASDCRWQLREDVAYRVTGRFAGATARGTSTFWIEAVTPGPACSAPVRARWRGGAGAPGSVGVSLAGRRITVDGRWMRWPGADGPGRAGTLVLSNPAPAVPRFSLTGVTLTVRGVLIQRVERIFGRVAPTVDALILARKERLDPEVRDSYARSGVAHLLAISGFHVGVVAGLLSLASGAVGGAGPFRRLAPALGVWVYVLLIGAPPAAVRAASIGSVLAASRLRGHPTSRSAGLAVVLLVFLILRPGTALDVGFQLSFAGAAGLVFLTRRIERYLEPLWPQRLRRRGLSSFSVSLAATVATAPVVAWHFGELPLLGIPMTAVLTPLIAAAIVGALASLGLDLIHPLLGGAVAGGTTFLLDASAWIAGTVGRLDWVVVGAGRPALLGGIAGGVLAWLIRPNAWAWWGKGGPRSRSWVLGPHLVGFALAGVLAGPWLAGMGGRSSAELIAVDVGQGDAIAIRSPGGRWLLVDAGASGPGFDAGASRVVPYLESRGVRRLEALVVSHPDLDHFGGAKSVLEKVQVGHIVDPGVVAPKADWRRLLETAEGAGVPWMVVDSAHSWTMDGLVVEVWRPPDSLVAMAEGSAANAASLIVLVRFGAFAALLTGDAPIEVEEAFATKVGDVDVLKVGHHGSRTSTSDEFLSRVLPEVGIVSVGKRNRYGHPHPTVLERLKRFGVRVVRTDHEGTVTIRFKADGRYWLH